MVVGCTKEHLADLVEQYKRRPFIEAELWAGKIARALQKYEGRINEEDLAEETGLTPDQIEAGVTWQNIEFLRWCRRTTECAQAGTGESAPPRYEGASVRVLGQLPDPSCWGGVLGHQAGHASPAWPSPE